MGFPFAEVIRIAAAPIAALTGPLGPIAAPAMIALANELDKEDTIPEQVRKMKEKRRKGWIEYRIDVERDNLKLLKKWPTEAHESIKRSLDDAATRDLAAVIKGDIFETENRFADDEEIRVLSLAVSARVREKLA